jgi:hypothetical protein
MYSDSLNSVLKHKVLKQREEFPITLQTTISLIDTLAREAETFEAIHAPPQMELLLHASFGNIATAFDRLNREKNQSAGFDDSDRPAQYTQALETLRQDAVSKFEVIKRAVAEAEKRIEEERSKRQPSQSRKRQQPSSKPNLTSASITIGSVADSPTDTDYLGFKPYVDAVSEFLLSTDTKPPLTMSIEGEWGSGKSSFMKQLASEIKRREPTAHIVWFYPWRHDKSDALWAAFATTFVDQIAKQMPLSLRIRSAWKLFKLRFNWRAGWPGLARSVGHGVLWLSAFTVLSYMWGLKLFSADDLSSAKQPETFILIGGVFPIVAVVIALTRYLNSFLGNPLSHSLSKHMESLDYTSRFAFIEQFHRDFGRIVDTYTENRRTFVFVDDLDRCEVPAAAELMQALNLMIAEEQKIFFILGLDREKVGAGIAAKHEKILKYLAPRGEGEFATGAGLNYGLSFLEKFIQLPFQLPTPAPANLSGFLQQLRNKQPEGANDSRITQTPSPTGPAQAIIAVKSVSDRTDFVLDLNQDSEIVREMVRMVAPALDFNPRRLKQFVNVFRLRVFICNSTGLLDFTGNQRPPVTLQQLAKFVAISPRWPMFLEEVERSLTLLDAMYAVKSGLPSERESWWISHVRLTELLRYQGAESPADYSLLNLDIPKLLAISPLVPRTAKQQITGSGLASTAQTGTGQVVQSSSSVHDLGFFTDEEMVNEFLSIPYIPKSEIESQLSSIRQYLNERNIQTRAQLHALISNTGIRNWLERLYVTELRRDEKRPLDVIAIATWLAYLSTAGFTKENQQRVLRAIQGFPEWKQKNKVVNASAQKRMCIENLRQIDGAKEQWALETKRAVGADVIEGEVNRYLVNGVPIHCPAGGNYTYGKVGDDPRCSVPGHGLTSANE